MISAVLSGRPAELAKAAGTGALAGLGGATVMLAGEKVEQLLTHRPNSYVPGRTLMTLFGRHPSDRLKPQGWNLAMHFATGAALGTVRGLWAATGLRGPRADLGHTVARLCTDQTLENATGAGAPPHTWPLQEQVVDGAHKAVYAFATGLIADRLIAPRLQSLRGRTSH